MLKRRSKSDKAAMTVAQRVVEDIERLKLEPGDMLPPQWKMTEDYGVGRGTLRESLRFLEFQGVLSFRRGTNGGAVVRQPDGESLATAMAILLQFDKSPYGVISEARAAFEPMVARMAAERITATELAALEETVVMMGRSLDDTAEWIGWSNQFHAVIAWASGNTLFGHLTDALLDVIASNQDRLGADISLRRRRAQVEAHQHLFELLRDHDVAATELAMRDHIDDYARYAKRHQAIYRQRLFWH